MDFVCLFTLAHNAQLSWLDRLLPLAGWTRHFVIDDFEARFRQHLLRLLKTQ